MRYSGSFRRLSRLLCTTSLLCCVSVAAHAQSAGATSDASPAASETQSGQEEIVVTAQKRSENIQDVPIAITAVTDSLSDKLGLEGTLGLQVAVPALSINQTAGGGVTATIRGATATGALGDESITAIYVDGVYLAGTPGLYFNLNNIERVEVLKGPQGTLFGRNAVGGAIQIITKTPEYTPSAIAELGYANYNTVSGQFYATGGLSDNVAIDFAALGVHQGTGWGRNIFLNEEIYKNKQGAVRSKLLWEPTKATQVVFAGSYSHVELAQYQGRAIYEGRLNLTGISQASLGSFYNTEESNVGPTYTDQYTASVSVKHDFGPVSLTSVTGYENTYYKNSADLDQSQLRTGEGPPLETKTKSFTQEVQLVSNGSSPFQWILGAFYLNSKNAYFQGTYTAPVTAHTNFTFVDVDTPVTSVAGFAQATYEVLPGTKLTGGLRYTIDKHSITGISGNQSTQAPTTSQSIVDKKLNYRLAISQDLGDVLLYASTSTAFKSGLFAPGSPNDPPVRPSFVTAYELGMKGDFFDRVLRLNVSAFWNDLKDIQVRTRLPNNAGNRFTNAASGRSKGIDADFVLVPSSAFTLRGGISYVDSKYLSYPGATFQFPRPNNIGNSSSIGDASGKKTILSPEFVGSVSATYTLQSEVGTFDFTASEVHNSGYFFDPQNRVKQDPYDLVNLSVQWTSPSKTYSITAFVKNLTQEEYYTSVVSTSFGDGMGVGDPRSYGVSVKARF